MQIFKKKKKKWIFWSQIIIWENLDFNSKKKKKKKNPLATKLNIHKENFHISKHIHILSCRKTQFWIINLNIR